MAAKTLKNPYRTQAMTFKPSQKGKKTNTIKKTESCIFHGFGVSISDGYGHAIHVMLVWRIWN